MKISAVIIQLLFFIAVSPLISGLISKIKNNIRMRKGPSLLQPYYNLAKLFSKGEVVSETASWIFKAAPFIVLSSALTAALFPVLIISGPNGHLGDFLALIFIFSLGRFFLALAALDTGSSFGGMGSSREMFISSLVEPAFCLAVFALSLQFDSTEMPVLARTHPVSVCGIVIAITLFLVTLAETSRVPVDNQETHLELTMVHEAMALEYSGRSLALIEMASYLKQMIWFLLIAQLIFPFFLSGLNNPIELILRIFWYLAGMAVIALITAVVEISLAKMRLFRAADFLGFAFVLGVLGVICAIIGV